MIKSLLMRGHKIYMILFLAIMTLWFYGESITYPLVFDSLDVMRKAKVMPLETFPDWAKVVLGHRIIVDYIIGVLLKALGSAAHVFKAINVWIHLCNVIFIFLILRRLIVLDAVNKTISNFKLTIFSGVGAALFAVNAVGLYTVLYVAQMYLLLACFFCLVSLYAFLRFDSKWHWFWGLVSLLSFGLALKCKETVIMWPVFLVFLSLALGLPKKWSISILFGMTLFGLATILTAKGIWFEVHESHAVTAFKSLHDGQQGDFWHWHGLSVLNQMWLFGRYVLLWFLPLTGQMAIDLNFGFPEAFWTWPQIFGALLYPLWGVLGFWLLFRTSHKALSLFLLMPWVLFGTEFSVIRYHESFVLYRSYFWMLLAMGLIPWAVLKFVSNIKLQFLGLFLMVLYGVGQGAVAQGQMHVWKSPLSLWQESVDKIPVTDQEQPSMYRAYANLGLSHLNVGNSKKAVQNFTKSVELNPYNTHTWFSLGYVNFLEGNWLEAAVNLQKALAINPEHQESLAYLGKLSLKAKDYLKADYYFNKVKDAKVDLAELAYQAGNELLKDGGYDRAKSYLIRATKANGAKASYWLQLGKIQQTLSDWKESARSYGMVLALEPENEETLNLYGQVLMNQDLLPEAAAVYKKLIQIDPANGEWRLNAGVVATKMGLNRLAEQHFKLAIQYSPHEAKAYYNYGNTLATKGEYKGALSSYQRAIKMEPSNVAAMYNAALMCKKLQDFPMAKRYVDLALEINPKFDSARRLKVRLEHKPE